MILVRFADRGLVVKGKPDLLLFQQLYWIVFGAFFILGILSYPLTQVLFSNPLISHFLSPPSKKIPPKGTFVPEKTPHFLTQFGPFLKKDKTPHLKNYPKNVDFPQSKFE